MSRGFELNTPEPSTLSTTALCRSPMKTQVSLWKEFVTSLKRKRRRERPSLALQACRTANRTFDLEYMNFDLALSY